MPLFSVVRDQKLSRYAMGTCEFDNGIGDSFHIQIYWKDYGFFQRPVRYYSVYDTGLFDGQKFEISEEDAMAIRARYDKKWGYVDWKGDWVPGTHQKTPPIIWTRPGFNPA